MDHFSVGHADLSHIVVFKKRLKLYYASTLKNFLLNGYKMNKLFLHCLCALSAYALGMNSSLNAIEDEPESEIAVQENDAPPNNASDSEVSEPLKKTPAVQHSALNYPDYADPQEYHAKPEEKGMNRFMAEFANMMFMLGLIVAGLFLLTWLLKRFTNTRMQQLNTTSHIKIIERRSLSPKSTIFLLEINGQGIVIAESTAGVHKVGEFELDREAEGTQNLVSIPEPGRFEKILDEKRKSAE